MGLWPAVSFAFALAFLSLSWAGCSTQPTSSQRLTTSAVPEDGGAVEPSGGVFERGSVRTLTAVPAPGYEFQQWEGDAEGTANPVEVRFDADRYVTAVFAPVLELPGYEQSVLARVHVSLEGGTIVDEPKIPILLRTVEEGSTTYDGHAGIEYRGSTSQRLFEKKSYGLETWDASGEDIDAALLGFPEEEDWILYGPYSDKTLVRNVLVYGLARAAGHWASRTRFVELEIDGAYQGVYVFMEKIKRDRERVDIAKLESDENDGEDLTGGYLLKIDKTTGDTGDPDWSGDSKYTEPLGFRSAYGVDGAPLDYAPYGPKQGEETYFLYEYPDYEDITSAQKAYIREYVHGFETALLEGDFTDPDAPRAYASYIDVDSFVDFFLLNELAHNADAYRLSTFLHKDKNGPLRMGPVWDFNLSLGNDENEYRRSPQTWIWQYNRFLPGDLWLVPFWWERLLEDPVFRARVRSRWQELRAGPFADSALLGEVDRMVGLLEGDRAVERNFNRWPVLGVKVFGNGFVGATYREEVVYLKEWIRQRTAWMDAQIAGW